MFKDIQFKIEHIDANKVTVTIWDNGLYQRVSINLIEHGITKEQLDQYLTSLIAHIKYVRQAGEFIGVSEKQLREHDRSKFDLEELPQYARHFYGDKGDPDGWVNAWLHHVHANPHHWGHWKLNDTFTVEYSSVENGLVFMPEKYVLEMVADWLGASKAYSGSWNMVEWVADNLGKIELHSKSREYLLSVLADIDNGKVLEDQ